jgi:hypothetical protein
MCVSPVQGLLAGANVGIGLFGASQQARAANMQGQAAFQSAMSQSGQSLLEAQIAEANARMAMVEAGGRMGQVDTKVESVIGHNRADAAARGIAVDQGSPLLDQAYVAAQGNIDKQLIAGNAYIEQANQLSRAASAYGQASQALQQGGQALASAKYGAGTAWLGGLANGVKSLGGLQWGSFKDFSQGLSRFAADPSSAWS